MMESGDDVLRSVDLCDFSGCVLLKELADMEVPTTDTDVDLVSFFDFHSYSSLSKNVNAFRLFDE